MLALFKVHSIKDIFYILTSFFWELISLLIFTKDILGQCWFFFYNYHFKDTIKILRLDTIKMWPCQLCQRNNLIRIRVSHSVIDFKYILCTPTSKNEHSTQDYKLLEICWIEILTPSIIFIFYNFRFLSIEDFNLVYIIAHRRYRNILSFCHHHSIQCNLFLNGFFIKYGCSSRKMCYVK